MACIIHRKGGLVDPSWDLQKISLGTDNHQIEARMGVSIPESPLSSTEKLIPLLGFGTAEYPFGASADSMKESILEAMKIGYRHFDSAALYQSEQPLGEAIKEALSLGIIKSRDDLFITSKLWCSDAHRHCVIPALHKSLKCVHKQINYLFNTDSIYNIICIYIRI